MNKGRRGFLRSSAFFGTGILASKTVAAQHEHHQQPQTTKKEAAPQPQSQSKIVKPTAPVIKAPVGNVPVITPDIPKLEWTMENGAKMFHLSADVVKREFLPASSMGPAKIVDVWGYNGSMPGPTIEVNEGDRVRIMFHNNLPEDTTVHWHGLEVPIEMDGTPYISQPMVKPGGMFIYEFTLNQHGTFFYHSHGAMQEMMGQIGLFIIHPKKPHSPPVHKDFGLILQEWAILPNNTVPNTMAMEFNWLTINGKSAPATTPMIVKQGERVRIRMVNLGMDHHPMHIHGHQFYVTGTEGGRIPQSAWFPGNTVLVGVAQARDIEFDAVYVGDWMLHCHLPHHMMNNMVSMVGPMSHAGHGMQTGAGMEEGMGVVRQGHALSEHLGPAMGRGMGITADKERSTSNIVGQHEHQGGAANQEEKKKVPGYPQDDLMMTMFMDKEVAKPETLGLAPGWTASLQGMMSLIRVLPPDKYEKVMAAIKQGKTEQPQSPPAHKHHEE
jgi:FtsP/CotA-like multicopper oxidase with cupredoxin domain